MASKKHVFSQIEKKVFLDVLKSYSAIVENKSTDGATLREKNAAWDNITREYNASPHATAEVSNKQLRRLWINLKQRQREAMTKERQHRMATGGGPSTSSAVIDPDVAQIAPALMVEIPGSIDSDSVFLETDQVMDIDSNLSLDITQPMQITDNILQTDQSPTHPTPPSHHITDPSPHTITSQPTIITPPPLTITTPPPRTTTTPPPRTTTTPPPRTMSTPPPPRTTTTPPPPRTATTPPPPAIVSGSAVPIRSIPLPPQSTSSTSTTSFLRHKNSILDKEYMDRFNRAREIHAMEKELLAYKIREAKAKAELAELMLQQQRAQEDPNEPQ